MSFKIRQLARQAARLTAVATILVMLSGCQASSATPRSLRFASSTPPPTRPASTSTRATTARLQPRLRRHHLLCSCYSRHLYHFRQHRRNRQVLSRKSTFLPATQYTILIGNTAASLQQLTLKDQNQPAPAGQFALRFIDQTTRTGPVDIYLVPTGQPLTDIRPIVTNITSATTPDT